MLVYFKEKTTMEKRNEQINIRFTSTEYADVKRRASERKQKVSEFLRDLLRFGLLPELSARR